MALLDRSLVFREGFVHAIVRCRLFGPRLGHPPIAVPRQTLRPIPVNFARFGLQHPTCVGFFAFENRTQL